MAVAKSLDALLDNVNGKTDREAYNHKMIHPVPDLPVVDRRAYVKEHCRDKIVLDIGAQSGTLHQEIVSVAKKAYALDREKMVAQDYIYFDLENCHDTPLPPIEGIELVVAGEVIEHLSNPGHALRRMNEAYRCPLLVTVPNAHSSGGFASLSKGIESVNRDHVAWYSYWTLRWLLERHKYKVAEAGWYNGKPKVAEGLVMLAEPT